MTSPNERSPGSKEKVTPFLERSIVELIGLSGQLLSTPFAFLRYNRAFQDQIAALKRDDLETAYPVTVARPLSFFVLLMGAHLLLSSVYWRMAFPALHPRQIELHDNRAFELFKKLADKIGKTEAIILIAFAITLIIAAKAYFVSSAGKLLNCRIEFSTALHASAYAFGTFLFFQYVFIAIRVLIGVLFGDPGFHLAYALNIYGAFILSMILIIRVNQLYQQADGVEELPAYVSWFIGTIAWHFALIAVAAYTLNPKDGFWKAFLSVWSLFGQAVYPPIWYTHPNFWG